MTPPQASQVLLDSSVLAPFRNPPDPGTKHGPPMFVTSVPIASALTKAEKYWTQRWIGVHSSLLHSLQPGSIARVSCSTGTNTAKPSDRDAAGAEMNSFHVSS